MSKAAVQLAPALDRNDRRRQRTRQAILKAASEIFREKGVAATVVTDITTRADVAYGSFYKYFKSLDDVVEVLAEGVFERLVERTREIMNGVDDLEVLPCVGARVLMRIILGDPASRWLLDRPDMFIGKFRAIGSPYMLASEREAVEAGRLRPAGGHDAWLRSMPWILLCELRHAVETGRYLEHEETFALISLRLLGINDATADALLARSEELVHAHGINSQR